MAQNYFAFDNVARSRNDILATQDRLKARRWTIDLTDALCGLIDHLLEQADRYADTVMTGYTHLQPAQPISYGFYLEAAATALTRDCRRLADCHQSLDACPLGAGALAGTPFKIDPEITARLLGFSATHDNALDAVASRDFGLQLLSAITMASVTFGRIAQDFHTWCSNEFDLLDFPDRVAGSSSIMPQKKNPVAIEFLKSRAGKSFGHLSSAMVNIKGTHFTHTADGNRESMSGITECATDFLQSITLMDLVIRTAEPKASVMQTKVTENFATATDLADLLVTHAGMPFRQAHHVVGAVVRQALQDEIKPADITSEIVQSAALAATGQAVTLPQTLVSACFNPTLSIKARQSHSSPNPTALRARLHIARKRVENLRSENQARRTHSEQSDSTLAHAIDNLAALEPALNKSRH